MEFEPGKLYAIIGPSGTGKTTLLSLMSGLTQLKEGDILFEGQSIKAMDMYEFRSHQMAMIFQSYYLLNKLTALENVTLSMDIANVHQNDKDVRAVELLEKVGLRSRTDSSSNFKAFWRAATKSGYRKGFKL